MASKDTQPSNISLLEPNPDLKNTMVDVLLMTSLLGLMTNTLSTFHLQNWYKSPSKLMLKMSANLNRFVSSPSYLTSWTVNPNAEKNTSKCSRSLETSTKKQGWGWLWSEGAQQTKLEESLDV